VVLRGLVSAYDEVHRPGRLAAAANAHAALDASAPSLASSKGLAQGVSHDNIEEGRTAPSSSSSSSLPAPTLVGKCARVALGRGCAVVITEDWCEDSAAASHLSISDREGDEAKRSDVKSSLLENSAPHEFTRIQPKDLPSLEETKHVSSGFANHFS